MKKKGGRKNRSSIMSDLDYAKIDVEPLIRDCMIRFAFNMFDEDSSGDIDKDEFAKLVKALGLEINAKKQADLMREIDKDGSGTIYYNEFFDVMSKFQFGKESDIEMHLESAFNDFDKDMDSEINVDDLQKVSEELDETPMTKEDAQLLIAFCKYFGKEKGVHSSGNGINKIEYINMLSRLGFLKTNEFNKNDKEDNNKNGVSVDEGEDKENQKEGDANEKTLKSAKSENIMSESIINSSERKSKNISAIGF